MIDVFFVILSLVVSLCMFTACDEGTINPKEAAVDTVGRVAKVTADLKVSANWTDDMSLYVAGFNGSAAKTSNYALTCRHVSDGAIGRVSVMLENIPAEVTHVELCVLNRLRERVYTIASVRCSDTKDTILLDCGTIDASVMAVLQTGLFDTSCSSCHGATGAAARNLFLTQGHSADNLVNIPSEKIESTKRIVPGDAKASLLYQILTDPDMTRTGWSANHYTMIGSNNDMMLRVLETWINNGCK